jgi:hypothetical protein
MACILASMDLIIMSIDQTCRIPNMSTAPNSFSDPIVADNIRLIGYVSCYTIPRLLIYLTFSIIFNGEKETRSCVIDFQKIKRRP